MGTFAIAAPLLPDMTDAWREWIAELQGPRAGEFADFNARIGLTRHAAWLQPMPTGDIVSVLIEGPGVDTFFSTVAASDDKFDIWFRETAQELHGVDFSNPPPLPVLSMDARS